MDGEGVMGRGRIWGIEIGIYYPLMLILSHLIWRLAEWIEWDV